MSKNRSLLQNVWQEIKKNDLRHKFWTNHEDEARERVIHGSTYSTLFRWSQLHTAIRLTTDLFSFHTRRNTKLMLSLLVFVGSTSWLQHALQETSCQSKTRVRTRRTLPRRQAWYLEGGALRWWTSPSWHPTSVSVLVCKTKERQSYCFQDEAGWDIGKGVKFLLPIVIHWCK